MTIEQNADGLSQAYGRDQGGPAIGGEIGGVGVDRVAVIALDYTDFAAFGTEARLGNLPIYSLPEGALITEAYIDVDTGFVSAGSATLDIGIVKEDGTVVDANGLFAATAKTAIDTVGERAVGAGALINGAKTTVKSFISATVGTADFTAGAGRLVVTYRLNANV